MVQSDGYEKEYSSSLLLKVVNGIGAGVGVGLAVGVAVAVAVGLGVAVLVGVAVGMGDAVFVGDGVTVAVGTGVGLSTEGEITATIGSGAGFGSVRPPHATKSKPNNIMTIVNGTCTFITASVCTSIEYVARYVSYVHQSNRRDFL